jgi:hypothetical protein
MSSAPTTADQKDEPMQEAVKLLSEAYSDARDRTGTIRLTALTGIGFLSVVVGFVGPSDIVGYRGFSAAGLVALLCGFAPALAVLLRIPTRIPYDTEKIADPAFLKMDPSERTREQTRCLIEADRAVRDYNKRSARLVNISLSAFVASVLIFGSQAGLGGANGMYVGIGASILVIGVGWLLWRYSLGALRQGAGETAKRGKDKLPKQPGATPSKSTHILGPADCYGETAE